MEQEDQRLLVAKEFFELIGVCVCDIISPIDSDIYCVKRIDNQWAAFRVGNPVPVVPFGEYNHMWGFDNGFCLVSVKTDNKTTFANRGIINEGGVEVVEPYAFSNIWSFYGKGDSFITVSIGDRITKLDKKMLKLL